MVLGAYTWAIELYHTVLHAAGLTRIPLPNTQFNIFQTTDSLDGRHPCHLLSLLFTQIHNNL